MLSVNNLVTSYGLIKALKGVSLEAKKGAVTCILGPNGAGKTTLMFTLAGILTPDTGTVNLLDQNLTGLGAPKILRKGLALVPENRLVFADLSVYENLLAGAFTQSRAMATQVSDDIEKMYDRFPILKDRHDQPAGNLSGGEQQMLALARALMSRPSILLMDEPSVGLSPIIVDEIFAIIKQLNEDGMSILLVEQNATKALQVADYFYLLDQGKVTFSGTPDQVKDDDIIKRAYLGGG
ncbi:ABC transporter ATP-binding protein [Candidatus Njordibacter sp. Uisw_039]|jgi:branched-chain amino acid transport system ATP-binding protein|uniref:ABC transporter ATP-binding protein n=1 Tax=Candidatus Njordibacter sp. Uisw_039 TaxID=3230972 RepID=UPI003A266AE0|tara:strand:+ start:2144 stop:2857 length:714 start_codon:yes stop_codon:yes gene_type:complete